MGIHIPLVVGSQPATLSRQEAVMNRGRGRGKDEGGYELPSEQENDAAIAHMADRASMLRQVTVDIQGEVDQHNRLLDTMGTTMDTTRGFVGGTVEKFKKTFDNKDNRIIGYVVAGCTVLLLILWIARRG